MNARREKAIGIKSGNHGANCRRESGSVKHRL
jgi:hypothetical protein